MPPKGKAGSYIQCKIYIKFHIDPNGTLGQIIKATNKTAIEIEVKLQMQTLRAKKTSPVGDVRLKDLEKPIPIHYSNKVNSFIKYVRYGSWKSVI